MNFVFPQFLWALSALSIPIIIHLFNFRKTTRIYFSNTRLLKQVKEETTQKRKLKKYLVLASRLLFLLFLVLAFAQPFLPASEQMTSGKNMVIYLDNSYSMSAQVEDKVRALDAGVGFAKEIVNLFPDDTRYKFITNDFAPFSNTFKSKTEVEDLLAQTRLSPISRTFNEVTRRMGEPMGNDIFWISDFQKSTFGNEDSAIDSANQWHMIPIVFNQSANVFVDTVFLDNPFSIGGEKNAIKLRLKNTGAAKKEGLITKLSINGIQSATAAIDIEPNSVAETSFDLTSGLSGLNEAAITFSDFPVSFDNEFFLALNFSAKIRVVEIREKATSNSVQRVYGNNSLFTFKSFDASNVDYSMLAQADLVVVNGVNKLDGGLSASLGSRGDHVQLLLISGNSPDVLSYQALLGRASLSKIDSTELTELDRPDFLNPFFANVFEEKSISLAMPRASKVLDWGNDPSAILKFKNGQPFLSRDGNVFIMACPLEKEFTDFYNQAIFVPVMYRIAASSRRDENMTYYHTSESLISLRADSLIGEEPVKLIGQQEIVPTQRKLNDQLIMEIPKFAINPGFYRAIFQRDTLDLFAFNLDKTESSLDQYTEEQIMELLGNGNNVSLFQASSVEAFSNAIKERYLGTPLWKYAIVLALCFLLAEVLLIRFLK
ncbi:MAG: VWA domain-containing protein [Bacteroidia bacterium]|nr:VWA domain-containing protein [Bacteroidia bacterium]